jgi:hypothetical protein
VQNDAPSRAEDAAERSWADGVSLVTAVSGGSYVAASFAMVNQGLSAEERRRLPAYAPGSPEDNRLRAHTRYLVEDRRAAAVGVISILYGLVLNLIPILAGTYITAKILGWFLNWTSILTHTSTGWVVNETATTSGIAFALAALGLAIFAAARVRDIYRPPEPKWISLVRMWTLRLLAASIVVLVLLVLVPVLLHLLSDTRINVEPVGFDWKSQLASIGGTTVALAGLVKSTIGRFKSKLQVLDTPESSPVGRFFERAGHAVAPWLASAIVLGLLSAVFLTWTSTAAYAGASREQAVRVLFAIGTVLLWRLLTDVNRNSMHSFYKERLSSAFAVQRKGDSAEEIPFQKPIRLSSFRRPEDRPQLVLCAAVNTDREGVVPSGRGCAPFTFSARWTGITSGTMFSGEENANPVRMLPTEQYEDIAGHRLLTLPAAVAVSGAAVSPVMGRATRAPLRLVLGLANVRLGLWLPNPMRTDLTTAPAAIKGQTFKVIRWQWHQPGMSALLAEVLGRIGLQHRWVYVTDGGHYENLGLVEALRRGATEIVVLDASGDPPESWTAFGQAVSTARADLGVEISLDPSDMKPAEGDMGAPTLVVRGTCRYANGVEATLILCKLARPAKAPWDVLAWAKQHPAFPQDSTTQQLYGDREFEAYRRLGETAASAALDVMATERLQAERAEVAKPAGRTGRVLPRPHGDARRRDAELDHRAAVLPRKFDVPKKSAPGGRRQDVR